MKPPTSFKRKMLQEFVVKAPAHLLSAATKQGSYMEPFCWSRACVSQNHMNLTSTLTYGKVRSPKDIQRLQVIGKSLQKLRLKSGYSQEEVAERLNITSKSYGEYERGDSTLTSLDWIIDCWNLLNVNLMNF